MPILAAMQGEISLTSIAAFKNTTQEVIDFYKKSGSKPIPGVPKFDPRRIVDGQRMMQFLKPLPPTSEGKTFILKSRVIGVYDKGKAGSVLETENLIMDKNTGEVRQRHTPRLGDESLLKASL
jgi:peroxisomal enoyl-CoA hydratase 2